MNNDSINNITHKIQQLDLLHNQQALSDDAHRTARAELEQALVAAVMASNSGGGEPTPGHTGTQPSPPTTSPRIKPATKWWAGIAVGSAVLAGAAYYLTAGPNDGAWQSAGAGLGGNGDATGAGGQAAPHTMDNQQMLGMVESLANKLKDQPDNAEGWGMLARSYSTLGRHAEAIPAYEKALKKVKDDPVLMADYADSLAVKQGRRLDGEPLKWVRKALELDPKQPKALLLAGTEAFNRKQYAEAAKHWNALVAVGPAGNPLVEQARAALQDANELGQLKPAADAPTTALATGASLGGRVELAPALSAKVAPTDEVMVFARAAAGSRMPLAMLRTTAKSFPLSFKLDDTMAMAPQANLSSAAGELVVVVRIGKRLQAAPQPGDIEAVSAPVKVGAPDVLVTVR